MRHTESDRDKITGKEVENMKLSLKGLGCWFVIANMKKQGEHITMQCIAEKTDSSIAAVRTAIAELINKGYLKREFIREGGIIRGIEYVIVATPKSDENNSDNKHKVIT